MKQKRGQFYLIAALVAVAVLLGAGTIFIHARVPQTDTSVNTLIDEMQDEVFEIINRDFYNHTRSEHTWLRIEGLTQNYSLSNPSLNIIILYGNTTKFAATSYIKGIASSLSIGLLQSPDSSDVLYNATDIVLQKNSNKYALVRAAGIDYHLYVQKEDTNGKTIALR